MPSYIEKNITKKAEKRFRDSLRECYKILQSNDILKSIQIGEFFLTSESGYNSRTDLFVGNNQKLLYEKTNLEDLKKMLIEKYEQEETDELFKKLETIKEFLEN